MQVHLKGKRIAIEKIKKHQKGQGDGLLIMPNSEEYLGTIIYVGPDVDPTIKVGQKVYFSTNYQQVRMGSKDLCVMNDSEVFATVED